MDTLAGYIASVCVGAAGTYLSQFLKPKIKIRYWFAHSFTYTIPTPAVANPAPALPAVVGAPAPAPPANFFLLTQSVTIQNFGRETAQWVEIAHNQKPDFFQLHPTLTFVENVNATGQHTILVQSLAPGEFFTIQFLCYSHAPQMAFVRSNAGHASLMPWLIVKKFPKWVYVLWWLLMLIGGAFCAYWAIKGGAFVIRSVQRI